MGLDAPIEPEATFTTDAASGSFTAQRLQHATPQHLHLTTRRCFIGPIPEGWLKSHRKSWYKEYLSLSNYSSHAATFSASSDVAHRRQITGLDGPSVSATLLHSFPQPADATSDDEQVEGEDGEEPGHDEGHGMAGDDEYNHVEDDRQGPKPQPRFKQRLASPSSNQTPGGQTFVTAPMRHRGKGKKGKAHTSTRRDSFVTASEGPVVQPAQAASTEQDTYQPNPNDATDATKEQALSKIQATGSKPPPLDTAQSSTVSLLQHGEFPATDTPTPRSTQRKSYIAAAPGPNGTDDAPELQQPAKVATRGLVKFNVPDDAHQHESDIQAEPTPLHRRRSFRRRHAQSRPGEIVKMEKMLVQINSTMNEIEPDYDENDSLKIETRPIEKWREYVVICRESTAEEADYSLQLYKTRVIPAVEDTHVQKSSTHEILLDKKTTKINLYSSLDKTLVIWVPRKQGKAIYILRTRSASSSVEWYTFLRNVLGHKRPSSLEINVPDLSVSLRLENPFGHLESSEDAIEAAKGNQRAIRKIMEAEKAVAGDMISQCMKMLENTPEWSDVLDAWLHNEKMGLAWKRYDRLEWVHGANEQKMYGTMAMQKSHELQLRPKQHYPTTSQIKLGGMMEEPAPVEGFLIRLTSQRGRSQRFGKMFFKRLYFSTYNQYLCYCRPAKAYPPPPPKLKLDENQQVPSASQIVEGTPLIFAVDPYPLKDGQIEWMQSGNLATKRRADSDAYKEGERCINSMLGAEGYINLSHVVKIRKVHHGASPADQNLEEGPDADFHREVPDSRRDDGKTDHFDADRTFEVLMKNDLVIRLQAYNKETRDEWMTRLEKLVRYWKLRLADDMNLFKQVRQENLKNLDIDEESEAYLGQFGRKWEVTRSIASPQLFNMCGISCCRTISMAGTLYHKPRRHTTFLRCGVILCHGQLLIFHGTLRERTGKEVPHIQHERQNVIQLKDCYIYSGLITEGDLLYQNQTFDSNHPGHHALPRVYLEDGWTSTDEDTMTCFVIWQARSRTFFKASEEQGEGKTRQRLRQVTSLGVPGRSIVFKTRSRAERDHWVMSIGMEIERLQQEEEIRVVPKK